MIRRPPISTRTDTLFPYTTLFRSVVIFEGAAEPSKDLDRILDGRLVHVDLLEPAQQGAVLFELVAEFLVRRRTNASDRPTREGRLQQVRCVHCAPAGRASADHGMDFVNAQNRLWHFFHFISHHLQTLL